MKTVVGDNCLFLANTHVGHDSEVGDHVILSNNVLLAVTAPIGEYASSSEAAPPSRNSCA